jgi:hypothetical protein
MSARTRARSTTKIESKNNLYPHNHFTEHLVNAFKKSPWENNLNQKFLSLLDRWLKNKYWLHLQGFQSQHNRNRRTAATRCACGRKRTGGWRLVPTWPKNEQRAEWACGMSRTRRPNKITAPGVSWTKHENESALETETGTGTEANGGRHRACSWRSCQLERERKQP